MKIAHISDVHLGYRNYYRVTKEGINEREKDVFKAFESALKKCYELQCDITIIAGDLFHFVRPSNYTIVNAFRQISFYQKKMEGKPLIIIGGNHDTPRALDAGCILGLLNNIPGVCCIFDKISNCKLNNINVMCLPWRAIGESERNILKPDPNFEVNILTVHGLLDGIATKQDVGEISRSKILSDEWDYIAMGDYHNMMQLAPNAFYSGATEFTSSNIWEEAGEPKGIIEFDTNTKLATFHKIDTRKVIQLPDIQAEGLNNEEVLEQILDNAVKYKIDDAIARQRIFNIPSDVFNKLDHKKIRELKNKAMNYRLENHRPERSEYQTSAGSKNDPTSRRTIEDEWKEYISHNYGTHHDKEEILALGISYLEKAKEKEIVQTADLTN